MGVQTVCTQYTHTHTLHISKVECILLQQFTWRTHLGRPNDVELRWSSFFVPARNLISIKINIATRPFDDMGAGVWVSVCGWRRQNCQRQIMDFPCPSISLSSQNACAGSGFASLAPLPLCASASLPHTGTKNSCPAFGGCNASRAPRIKPASHTIYYMDTNSINKTI